MQRPKLHSLGVSIVFCVSFSIVYIIQGSYNLKALMNKCIDLRKSGQDLGAGIVERRLKAVADSMNLNYSLRISWKIWNTFLIMTKW